MSHTLRYPIEVHLDRIFISRPRARSHARRTVRFTSSVAPNGDSTRAIVTRFDRRLRKEPYRSGHVVVVNKQVFEGSVASGESLLIVLRALPEDGGEIFFRAELSGDLTEWVGEGQSIRSPRRLYADLNQNRWRIEVSIATADPVEVPTGDRGEHMDHRRLAEEWRRTVWGPPASARIEAREMARATANVRAAVELPLPAEQLFERAHDGPIAVVGGRTRSVRNGRNPRPGASFGYASRVVELTEDVGGGLVDLVIPLRPERQVERASVRVFYWEPKARTWAPLVMSGAHSAWDAAWCRTRLRGRFVAVGLPTDPAVKETLRVIHQLRPLLSNARTAGISGYYERICHLILCAPEQWRAGLVQRPGGELEFANLPREPRQARELLGALIEDPPSLPVLPPALPGPGAGAPMPGGPIPDGPLPGGEFPPGGEPCEDCFGMPWLDDLPELKLWEPEFCGTVPLWPPPKGIFVKYPVPTVDRWQSIGPSFPSGVIRDFAIHPTDSGIIFAATQAGGVWRTTNGGKHWTPTTDHLPNLNAWAIAIARKAAPGDDYRTVYFGTAKTDLSSDFDLYASDDNGVTWDLRTAVPSTQAWELTTGKDTTELIYLAGDKSLHKSLDGGRTWIVHDVTVEGRPKANSHGIFDGKVWDVRLDPNNDDVIWIAVGGLGILVSSDGGHSWQVTTAGVAAFSGNGRIIIDVGADTSSGGHGSSFVVAKTGETIGYTTNGGGSWTVMPASSHHGGSTQSGWCSALAVCPDDEDWIVAGGFRTSETKDATAANPTWTDVPGCYWVPWQAPGKKDEYHPDIQAIRFDPTDSRNYFIATDGGITRVTPEGPQRISDGINASVLFHIDPSRTGTVLVGASTYHVGIIRRPAGSDQWPYMEAAEGGIYRIDPRDHTLHFCAPWGVGLRRSVSSGDQGSWSSPTLDVGGAGEAYPRELEFRPSGSRAIWAGTFYDRLHFSTNMGATWTTLQDGAGNHLLLDGNGHRNAGASAIAFAPSNPRIMYVGTRAGRIWTTKTAAQTSAGWSQVAALPKPAITGGSSRTISAIAIHPSDPDTLYVGYALTNQVNLYRSDDGGKSWHDATGAKPHLRLPRWPIVDIVMHPINPLTIYAATKHAVYYTTDGGDWWRPFDQGMPLRAICEMRVSNASRMLYVATAGRGAFVRDI